MFLSRQKELHLKSLGNLESECYYKIKPGNQYKHLCLPDSLLINSDICDTVRIFNEDKYGFVNVVHVFQSVENLCKMGTEAIRVSESSVDHVIISCFCHLYQPLVISSRGFWSYTNWRISTASSPTESMI